MSSNVVLIFLVLLSVLNTYSSPTTTLFKAIQNSAKPRCPLLRAEALNYSEPDYLKDCPYPLDPQSKDFGIIRCNLYLNQFNLLCESHISEITPYLLPEKDFQMTVSSEYDPCIAFTMPVAINNNSNIDAFIVKNCEVICKDIRTGAFEIICTAASYLRMSALKSIELYNNVDKTSRIPSNVQNPQDINNLVQTDNVVVPHEHAETNFVPSGNNGLTAGTTGNAGTPLLPYNAKEVVNDAVNDNQKGEISNANINGNTATVSKGKVEEKQTKKTTIQVQAQTETKHNDVKNPQMHVPKNTSFVVHEKETEQQTATLQKVAVDSKLTTAVEHDMSFEEDSQNNMPETEPAPQSTEKGTDTGFSENNNNPPQSEPDSRVETKSHGLTENEDEENLSHNVYREDERTVEDDSYFFTYFMMLCVVFVFAYVGYYNKQKIIAIVVEGRRSSSGGVGRGGRTRGGRRPNSANYHKLDSNLEEAVSSNTDSKNSSNVIY